MGNCQNEAPFFGTLNSRCRIILGTPKGTIILTNTHMDPTKLGFPGQGFLIRFLHYAILPCRFCLCCIQGGFLGTLSWALEYHTFILSWDLLLKGNQYQINVYTFFSLVTSKPSI